MTMTMTRQGRQLEVTGWPLELIAFQVPTSLTPCPLASPGLVSSAKVYSGMPVDSDLRHSARTLDRPQRSDAPFGAAWPLTVSGCHTPRHAALVQIHFPFCSPDRRYNVKPLALTRTVV